MGQGDAADPAAIARVAEHALQVRLRERARIDHEARIAPDEPCVGAPQREGTRVVRGDEADVVHQRRRQPAKAQRDRNPSGRSPVGSCQRAADRPPERARRRLPRPRHAAGPAARGLDDRSRGPRAVARRAAPPPRRRAWIACRASAGASRARASAATGLGRRRRLRHRAPRPRASRWRRPAARASCATWRARCCSRPLDPARPLWRHVPRRAGCAAAAAPSWARPITRWSTASPRSRWRCCSSTPAGHAPAPSHGGALGAGAPAVGARPPWRALRARPAGGRRAGGACDGRHRAPRAATSAGALRQLAAPAPATALDRSADQPPRAWASAVALARGRARGGPPPRRDDQRRPARRRRRSRSAARCAAAASARPRSRCSSRSTSATAARPPAWATASRSSPSSCRSPMTDPIAVLRARARRDAGAQGGRRRARRWRRCRRWPSCCPARRAASWRARPRARRRSTPSSPTCPGPPVELDLLGRRVQRDLPRRAASCEATRCRSARSPTAAACTAASTPTPRWCPTRADVARDLEAAFDALRVFPRAARHAVARPRRVAPSARREAVDRAV